MTTCSIALLYPGDRATRDRCNPAESRFASLFEAFARAGVKAVPAVYCDEFADAVEAQLRNCDLVLVWFNPIEGNHRRGLLDAMLRRVADVGVIVSAHPDTIVRLGTKDVLFDTRDLPFGSDVRRVDSLRQLEMELPDRLCSGARVLKQHRGHSGIGVWRVELSDPRSGSAMVRVRHAQRGSDEELLDMRTFLDRMAPYFDAENGGHLIDQAWQPSIVEGMVRAYLVEDRVVGFGYQAVNALYPTSDGQPATQPGPRNYHDAHIPQFQDLGQRLEDQWVRMLLARTALSRDRLPFLWDCDFMIASPDSKAAERYVLCEINVSSVSPFPPSAITPLVEAVRSGLKHRRPASYRRPG